MFRYASLLGLTLAVALLLAGCDTVRAPGGTQQDELHAADYPRVALLDGLDGWMAYDRGSAIVTRPEDRPMQVSVPLRLLSPGQAQEAEIQYRFIFFNADGAALHNQSGWQHRRMPARAEVQLQGIARSRDATDWRLEVRPAR